MSLKDIIDAINLKVGNSCYSAWTIGVTDYPNNRKLELENSGEDIKNWTHFYSDNNDVGRGVENYFLGLGMKTSLNDDGNAWKSQCP